MTKQMIYIIVTFIALSFSGCSYSLKYITLDEKSDNQWTEVKKAENAPHTENTK